MPAKFPKGRWKGLWCSLSYFFKLTDSQELLVQRPSVVSYIRNFKITIKKTSADSVQSFQLSWFHRMAHLVVQTNDLTRIDFFRVLAKKGSGAGHEGRGVSFVLVVQGNKLVIARSF